MPLPVPKPIQTLSAEFQLMLWCCRAPGAATPSQARALLEHVDAPVFLDLAINRHRIGALAHRALSNLPKGAVVEGLLAALAQEARANAVKTLQSQRAHRLLAHWFGDAGVDWMPFKGVTVAQACYEDPAARHVNDVDVWVPPQALPKAMAVLQSHGCRMLDGDLHADLATRGPRHAAYLARYYHELQFRSADVGALELHWRLADNPHLFALPPEAVRARAGCATVAGMQVPVMDDVDLLLYLCDHGGRHGWGRLKWLADLPRLLVSRQWDWTLVLSRADQARSRSSLLLGLGLCVHYLGWDAPGPVRAALQRCARLAAMMNLSLEFLAAPAMGADPRFSEIARSVLRELRLSLLLNPSLSSVLHQGHRYLLSPKDLRALELPDRYFSAYYLLRPLLLVGRRAGLLGSRAR